jgi:hypothetical protein
MNISEPWQGERKMGWQAAVNKTLDKLSKSIEAHIKKEVGGQYKEMVDDLVLYPEGKGGNAMWVHIWGCDEVVKRFSLETALLGWFDVPATEQTATRSQMEAWAVSLEAVAKRIRAVVAEQRYAEDE